MKKILCIIVIFSLSSLSYSYIGNLPYQEKGSIRYFNDKIAIGFIKSNVPLVVISSIDNYMKQFEMGNSRYIEYHWNFAAPKPGPEYITLINGSTVSGKNCTIHFTAHDPLIYEISQGEKAKCGIDAEGNILFEAKE